MVSWRSCLGKSVSADRLRVCAECLEAFEAYATQAGIVLGISFFASVWWVRAPRMDVRMPASVKVQLAQDTAIHGTASRWHRAAPSALTPAAWTRSYTLVLLGFSVCLAVMVIRLRQVLAEERASANKQAAAHSQVHAALSLRRKLDALETSFAAKASELQDEVHRANSKYEQNFIDDLDDLDDRFGSLHAQYYSCWVQLLKLVLSRCFRHRAQCTDSGTVAAIDALVERCSARFYECILANVEFRVTLQATKRAVFAAQDVENLMTFATVPQVGEEKEQIDSDLVGVDILSEEFGFEPRKLTLPGRTRSSGSPTSPRSSVALLKLVELEDGSGILDISTPAYRLSSFGLSKSGSFAAPNIDANAPKAPPQHPEHGIDVHSSEESAPDGPTDAFLGHSSSFLDSQSSRKLAWDGAPDSPLAARGAALKEDLKVPLLHDSKSYSESSALILGEIQQFREILLNQRHAVLTKESGPCDALP